MPTDDDAPRRAARAKPATGNDDVIPVLPPVDVPKQAFPKTSREIEEEEERRREMEQEEWEAREQIKIDWEEKQRKRFWLLRFMGYVNDKIETVANAVVAAISTMFRTLSRAIEFFLWLRVLYLGTVGNENYFQVLSTANGAIQEISVSSVRTAILVNALVLAVAFSVVTRFDALPRSKKPRKD